MNSRALIIGTTLAVMAFMSLGRDNGTFTSYAFDPLGPDFDILSFGPGFFAGDNPLGTLTKDGFTLKAQGGYGVIQFKGLVSSISWTVPDAENFSGFTVGIPTVESVVPAPSGFVLASLGALMFVGLGWRRGPPNPRVC